MNNKERGNSFFGQSHNQDGGSPPVYDQPPNPINNPPSQGDIYNPPKTSSNSSYGYGNKMEAGYTDKDLDKHLQDMYGQGSHKKKNKKSLFKFGKKKRKSSGMAGILGF